MDEQLLIDGCMRGESWARKELYEQYAPAMMSVCMGSPDKPGGLSIQLCKSEKKEFYIRYSS